MFSLPSSACGRANPCAAISSLLIQMDKTCAVKDAATDIHKTAAKKAAAAKRTIALAQNVKAKAKNKAAKAAKAKAKNKHSLAKQLGASSTALAKARKRTLAELEDETIVANLSGESGILDIGPCDIGMGDNCYSLLNHILYMCLLYKEIYNEYANGT